MVSKGRVRFNSMQNGWFWNNYSKLIEPLSYDQVCAIHLYTTNLLYIDLRRDIARHEASKWADYICELVVGINKLPMVWEKTFRGISKAYLDNDPTFFDGYNKNNILRWDGMNSTSLKESVATQSHFASSGRVIEMEGYHGRDIAPFAAYANEAEVIYIVSTHFRIDSVINKNGFRWYKVREMPFPWNSKAILWVDDKPENNKDLMEKLEREGKMIIPRKSTKAALDYFKFMKKIFLNNKDFDKYRIISDMTRYERKDEYDEKSEIICDTKAGARLVYELRQEGYKNKVCIYTSSVEHALNECAKLGCKDNVIATVSTQGCYKFCQY